MEKSFSIDKAPKGLAVFALIGPSFIWVAEYIGSGEVILSTRVGALLGSGVLWAIVLGIFLKFWIGLCGARYAVCAGEGMIDMFDRLPGPKHGVVWLVLVAQFISAAIAIGSIATAAGIFIHSLLPISAFWAGFTVTVLAFLVAWTGTFDLLKLFMSAFVFIIVCGIFYVNIKVFPGFSTLAKGLLIRSPEVTQWVYHLEGADYTAWKDILPLLGWAAGGFASQVWYSYWVLGAGYGMAKGHQEGQKADVQRLSVLSRDDAKKVKGWLRVVTVDASMGTVIGIVVTAGFLLAGAGILRPNHLAPSGPDVAITLSRVFSTQWGAAGGLMFLISGSVALISTQIGQLAGWPRLLADCFRICVPRFGKLSWKIQFRLLLSFFFLSNMIIVYHFGYKPVAVVKLGAILDGLLLTPLQALWVGLGLYWVLPRMLSSEARMILKSHWIYAAGLVAAFFIFGYFCVFQIPSIL